MDQLLNPQPTLGLQTTASPLPAVVDATPMPPPATTPNYKSRRRGRVASLPKVPRDMVNRMLWNGVPYKNIVAALDENGFTATERNISNWATGGYLEWRFEQDLALQNRLNQDHLVDHLRRDDASELPEVGLQAAATRLSQILLQKTANADDVEANLGSYSQMVGMLCRLTHQLTELQKQRDDSRRSLGPAHNPNRIKEEEQMSAIEFERYYSNPPSDSSLPKPAKPPILPPLPTSSFLEQRDREDAETRSAQNRLEWLQIVRGFSQQNQPGTNPSEKPALPETSPAR